MITLLIIFFPLAAAIILLIVKGEQIKKTALAASVIEFMLVLFALSQYQHNALTQFEYNAPWIKSLGINFHVGMDGISLLMVLLTTFLVPIIILTSFKTNYKNASVFYALILAMQFALVGVFVSLDGFLFYIFWELALIPIYFICLLWGGEDRARITNKSILLTLTMIQLMCIQLHMSVATRIITKEFLYLVGP